MEKSGIVALAILIITCLAAGTVWSAEIVVEAASSLADVLPDIRDSYLDKFRDEKVIFNFASSGTCYRQLKEGARADVYISANGLFMDKAEKEGLIDRRSKRLLAKNQLVLAVPAGNPAGIDKLGDLSLPRVTRIALGSPETVPAGQYARKTLRKKDLWDELEAKYVYAGDVREVLALLEKKEVDAGFIYRSDARIGAAKTDVVERIEIYPPVRYWAALTSNSNQRQSAAAFFKYLTSNRTIGTLKQYGFSPGN